jgi:C4-dicarboxylate-specific signal transduction histidine kinase/CheY-like chemotaxis protein
MSLRARLILLACACMLPSAALLGINQVQLRQAREAEVRREIAQLAQSAAAEMTAVTEGARQLLTALEQAPPIREHNDALCSALLGRLKREYPSYATITADDKVGRSFCSSSPGRATYDGDSYAFRAALDSRRFVIGDYAVSSLAQTSVLPLARPVVAADGTLLAVLVVSLDLDWLAHDLQSKLPPRTALTVVDRNLTVLLHIPGTDGIQGTKLPQQLFVTASDADHATAEVVDPQDVARIVAREPVGDQSYGLQVIAARAKDAAFVSLDRATREGVILIVSGLVLAFLAAGWVAARFIRAPIEELLTTATRLRHGEFSFRTDLTTGRSELSKLGRGLNALARALEQRESARITAETQLQQFAVTLEERVAERTRELSEVNAQLAAEAEERQRTQAELTQAQKLDAIGKLTGGVAHDFNNLLTAILGSLELATKRTEDAALKRLLAVAVQASQRGAKLIAHLLAFSRKQDMVLRPVNINDSIVSMSDLLRRTLGPLVRVRHDLAHDLWQAIADPVQLEVALLNLAVNARDAMPEGGELTFRSRNVVTLTDADSPEALPPGEYTMVTVSDTGIGMPESVQSSAFEPFFTTKGPGKGTGLGLSMVYGFAQQAGGTATIDSTLGKGTAIGLYLPRAATQSVETAAEPMAAITDMKRLRLLLVDDDAGARETTCEVLVDLGHDVVAAANGAAALEILRARQAFDVLIADFAMPEMTGVQLAAQAAELVPGLPILFLSGYADSDVLRIWSERGYRTLSKPFRSVELAAALHDVLRSPLYPARRLG